MSTAPPKPCRHPRCAAYAQPGRAWCTAHQPAARAATSAERAAQDDRRGSAASRGYGPKWREASLTFRARYPVCGGYLAPTGEHTRALAETYHILRTTAQEAGKIVSFLHERMAWLSRFPIYTVNFSRQSAAFGRPGCGRPTAVVDHIIPHRGDQELFWSQWNWQPLCKHCHDKKTASKDGGFRGAPRSLSQPAAPAQMLI